MPRFASIFLIAALTVLPSAAALAQENETTAAPAMFNVQEVLLQYAQLGDNAAADTCGISREDTAKAIIRVLQELNVPVLNPADAKPPMIGTARIDLIPTIVTVNPGGIDCISWVALAAETQSTVLVPPVETPRNVTVSYWRKGLLINSNQTAHSRIVTEAMEKLARQFASQYHGDQPPPLPNLDQK